MLTGFYGEIVNSVELSDLPDKRSGIMSEQRIVNIINKVLTGDMQTDVRDFMAYLQENEMIAGGQHGEVRP